MLRQVVQDRQQMDANQQSTACNSRPKGPCIDTSLRGAADSLHEMNSRLDQLEATINGPAPAQDKADPSPVSTLNELADYVRELSQRAIATLDRVTTGISG